MLWFYNEPIICLLWILVVGDDDGGGGGGDGDGGGGGDGDGDGDGDSDGDSDGDINTSDGDGDINTSDSDGDGDGKTIYQIPFSLKIHLYFQQVKDDSEPMTTERVLALLNSPQYKDPAALGNIVSSLLDSVDPASVDMSKVWHLSVVFRP